MIGRGPAVASLNDQGFLKNRRHSCGTGGTLLWTAALFCTDDHRIGAKPVTRRVWAPRGQWSTAFCHHLYQWFYVTAFVAPAAVKSLLQVATLSQLELIKGRRYEMRRVEASSPYCTHTCAYACSTVSPPQPASHNWGRGSYPTLPLPNCFTPQHRPTPIWRNLVSLTCSQSVMRNLASQIRGNLRRYVAVE